MDNKEGHNKTQIQRVSGRLHRINPILDAAGKVIHYAVSPLRVELKRRDLIQIIVGSSILAVPIGFTQETWDLGQSLPVINIIALAFLSLIFISAYVYYNFYRDLIGQDKFDYLKRVFVILVGRSPISWL